MAVEWTRATPRPQQEDRSMTHQSREATHDPKSSSISGSLARWAWPALSVALITACGSPDDAGELSAASQGLACDEARCAPVDEDAKTAVELGPAFDSIEFGAGLDEVGVLAQEAEPLDVDLQFALDNGSQSFLFAQTCRSVGLDGSVIDGDPLPVGSGRQLECETAPIGHLQTIDLQASTGEPFCALAQLGSFVGDGDPRLTVDVASAPDGAPWVLVGTSDGGEISVGTVTGFAGGVAWPLWVDALFDVIELQPNPNRAFCDGVFGL
jgi:hypothetical protein